MNRIPSKATRALAGIRNSKEITERMEKHIRANPNAKIEVIEEEIDLDELGITPEEFIAQKQKEAAERRNNRNNKCREC